MASPLINVMSAAAIKAAKALMRDFGEVDKLQISRKGTSDFVTASDTRTERTLMQELKKARPDFGFLCEESGETPAKDKIHRWIIDPVDGTNNFIHAIPYFCISIGLEKRSKEGSSEILAGLIYDPVHNELFTAERGKGAFLNDYRIQVSRRDSFDQSMIAMNQLRNRTHGMEHILQTSGTTRCFGASALDLANVACGRIDVSYHAAIKPWDIAAGLLLVTEAGGFVTDITGKPASVNSDTLLAGNPALHGAVLEMSRKAA